MMAVAMIIMLGFGMISEIAVRFTASLVAARTCSGRAGEETIHRAATKRRSEDHRDAEVHGYCQLKHEFNPNSPLSLGYYIGAAGRGQRRLEATFESHNA